MDKSSNERAAPMPEESMSIEEDPFWSKIVNTAAVILMIAAAFMWGYYA